MAAYAMERFMLAREEDKTITFLPFFAATPKEAWKTCEKVYGELHMHKMQDDGYKAVPVSMQITTP